MADANQTLTNTQYTKAIIKTTGALTAQRTLTFPHPASEAESYLKIVDNACTGAFSVLVSTGTGTTHTINNPGSSLCWFTPDGVTGAQII